MQNQLSMEIIETIVTDGIEVEESTTNVTISTLETEKSKTGK